MSKFKEAIRNLKFAYIREALDTKEELKALICKGLLVPTKELDDLLVSDHKGIAFANRLHMALANNEMGIYANHSTPITKKYGYGAFTILHGMCTNLSKHIESYLTHGHTSTEKPFYPIITRVLENLKNISVMDKHQASSPQILWSFGNVNVYSLGERLNYDYYKIVFGVKEVEYINIPFSYSEAYSRDTFSMNENDCTAVIHAINHRFSQV